MTTTNFSTGLRANRGPDATKVKEIQFEEQAEKKEFDLEIKEHLEEHHLQVEHDMEDHHRHRIDSGLEQDDEATASKIVEEVDTQGDTEGIEGTKGGEGVARGSVNMHNPVAVAASSSNLHVL